MVDTPTTEAGKRQHDLAWGDWMADEGEYVSGHSASRDGCRACALIATIEDEARDQAVTGRIEMAIAAERARLTRYQPDVMLVRVSRGVFDGWMTRDSRGDALTVEWGAPDADGFHEPVITCHSDDNLVAAERARIRREVEALEPMHPLAGVEAEPSGWYFDGWNEAIAAVLAIVDPA